MIEHVSTCIPLQLPTPSLRESDNHHNQKNGTCESEMTQISCQSFVGTEIGVSATNSQESVKMGLDGADFFGSNSMDHYKKKSCLRLRQSS